MTCFHSEHFGSYDIMCFIMVANVYNGYNINDH